MNAGPRVVIIGAGFGGLAAARALSGEQVEVLVVDRRNYHLFQPLLYQVATAGLAPGDIAHPVRAILQRQANARFRLGEVTAIDFATRRVQLTTEILSYDALILAVGGATSYFGQPALEQHAIGLKDLADALELRDRILSQFELAAFETERSRRQRQLTFVIAGGGPTGVECAGAISELIRLVLVRDFPDLDTEDVRVVLVEAGPSILDSFPPTLSQRAVALLRRKNVEVRLNAKVVSFDQQRVLLASGEAIPAETMVWAAGVQAATLIQKLDLSRSRQARAVVRPTLQLPDHPEVFVVGDAAYFEYEGEPLPMLAPVAQQQGAHAARNALRLLQGQALSDFEYRDPGTLATIGRNAAVARLGRWQFSGLAAWLIWLVVHIVQLIGFRNRLLVLINWAWDYFLYDRAVRLILSRRPPPNDN
jgi:NADH dehydrogenase